MFDPSKAPTTIGAMTQRSFIDHAPRPFLGAKTKGTAGYQFATYGDIAGRVKDVAGGLMQLGLQRGDRVALLAENRPEWAIADLACQMLGIVTVSLFSTLPPPQVRYILEDSGAVAVVVSNSTQVDKLRAIPEPLAELRYAIAMDESAATGPIGEVATLALAHVERDGRAYHQAHPTDYETAWPAGMADDVATLIYTSGTTGDPKGVMLTHRNLISNIEAILPLLDWSIDDVFLSFLPLAHVYERTMGYYLPVRLGASIAYCESLFTVDKNMTEVRPTIMLCVPRLLESIGDKLRGAAESLPAKVRGKYEDALRLAIKAGGARGRLPGSAPLGLMEKIKYRVYDAKVYTKIRERFGGRLRAFVSGGAPLSPEIGALFMGLTVDIWEGYGLTETSPVISVNRPRRVRLDTVGEIVGSVQVRIASDGEIQVCGPSVMKGYWNKPDATAAVLDDEGWFSTGDIGAVQDTYLLITDRKKDILVLANGKNVAPVPIEMRLQQSPYVAQVVLLGDKQKAVSALIVPQLDALKNYAKQQNVEFADDEALLQAPAIKKLLRDEIDSRTKDLADFEKVRSFVLLAKPFSIENGEMTPTLKLKRRVIAERYGNLVAPS